MASTVHAGPAWAAGLQSASNTGKGIQRLQQEREAHDTDQEFAQTQMARMQAEVEATEAETQIRQQTLQELQEQASVQAFLNRSTAQSPEDFLATPPDLVEQGLEGASEGQRQTFEAMRAQMQDIRGQMDEHQEVARYVLQEMQAVQGAEASQMPGYAEGVQALSDELENWMPGEGRDPAEIGAEFSELRQQNFNYSVRQDQITTALEDFNTSYGNDPELAFARGLLRQGPEYFDDAHGMAYEIKHPSAHAKTVRGAREQVVSEQQAKVQEGAFQALMEGATPEDLDDYMRKARLVFGLDVVPYRQDELDEMDRQEEQKAQVEMAQAMLAADVPLEEAKAAIAEGPAAVAAVIRAAQEDQGEEAPAPSPTSTKADARGYSAETPLSGRKGAKNISKKPPMRLAPKGSTSERPKEDRRLRKP